MLFSEEQALFCIQILLKFAFHPLKRIVNTEINGDLHVIDAMVPLSEMFGYATDLRSRSQGRGTFTMQFAHYEAVPKNVANKILGLTH